MSIKICILNTGETVIGDLKEAINSETKETVGYKIFSPYVVNYRYEKIVSVEAPEVGSDIIESGSNEPQISFQFWAPLSSDRDFYFPKEFIQVIYEPHDSIVQSYLSILEHWQKENTVEVKIDTEKTIVTSLGEGIPDNFVG